MLRELQQKHEKEMARMTKEAEAAEKERLVREAELRRRMGEQRTQMDEAEQRRNAFEAEKVEILETLQKAEERLEAEVALRMLFE